MIKYNIFINRQMSLSLEDDLRRMLEVITINTALPMYIESLDILMEHLLYFGICQRIFPDLRMKIIKIGQDQLLHPSQKMQQLIDLLSKELSINLSGITGKQILNGHLGQIHYLLGILEQFSQYQVSKSSSSVRVRSQPLSRDQPENPYPKSARDDRNNNGLKGQITESKNESDREKQYPTNGGIQYSVDMKKKRSENQERKNVYQSVLNTLWNQKNRMNKASLRNNKKKKNQDIQQAKNKYKSYLNSYAKQTKAKRNRQAIKKQKRPKSAAKFELLPQDFSKIDSFFESFAYRFRDQKHNFLRRMKTIIRNQELDRMCYANRIERQKNSEIEKLTKKQIQKINNEHKIRNTLLKQKLNCDKECIDLMKKQYEKYLREQKKELKASKRKELSNIKEYIDQENKKVLMQFEEGGRIEKLISDMYKRY